MSRSYIVMHSQRNSKLIRKKYNCVKVNYGFNKFKKNFEYKWLMFQKEMGWLYVWNFLDRGTCNSRKNNS